MHMSILNHKESPDLKKKLILIMMRANGMKSFLTKTELQDGGVGFKKSGHSGLVYWKTLLNLHCSRYMLQNLPYCEEMLSMPPLNSGS